MGPSLYDAQTWFAIAGLFATAWMLRKRPTMRH